METTVGLFGIYCGIVWDLLWDVPGGSKGMERGIWDGDMAGQGVQRWLVADLAWPGLEKVPEIRIWDNPPLE